MPDWTKPIWCKDEGEDGQDYQLLALSMDLKRAFVVRKEIPGQYTPVFSVLAETGAFLFAPGRFITNKPEPEPIPPAWPGVQEWPKPFSLMFQRCGRKAVFLEHNKNIGIVSVVLENYRGDGEWHVCRIYEKSNGRFHPTIDNDCDLRNAEPGELEGLERKAGA